MQVIHHLDAPGSSGHPIIKKFICEAYRVLKPGGGTLLINTVSPEQCKTPWYFSLLPQAQAQIASKYNKMHDYYKREREREGGREREGEGEREPGRAREGERGRARERGGDEERDV